MEIDQPIVPKWLVCGELPATYFGAKYARIGFLNGHEVYKAVCRAGILNYVRIKDISEIEDEE